MLFTGSQVSPGTMRAEKPLSAKKSDIHSSHGYASHIHRHFFCIRRIQNLLDIAPGEVS